MQANDLQSRDSFIAVGNPLEEWASLMWGLFSCHSQNKSPSVFAGGLLFLPFFDCVEDAYALNAFVIEVNKALDLPRLITGGQVGFVVHVADTGLYLVVVSKVDLVHIHLLLFGTTAVLSESEVSTVSLTLSAASLTVGAVT